MGIDESTISIFHNNDYDYDYKEYSEWSVNESIRAALFVSVLQSICKRVDCVLLDPHYYNITFVNNHPIYFDLGSFYMDENTKQYNDFSLVILGLYRILFSGFIDSVLSKQELGAFRYEAEKTFTQTNFMNLL